MLELTARHADAWNLAWFGLPDERLARVRGELVAACERVGRDPATLTITVGVTVRYPAAMAGTRRAADIARPVRDARRDRGRAAGARAAGAEHLIASLEPCTPGDRGAFAEAVERVPRAASR